MKHALMNPAFPDVVREWAPKEQPAATRAPCNDDFDDRVADYLASLQNERLIAAIRCW